MNQHDFVDAVELYEFARGWYAAEPEAPQPIPHWEQLVSYLEKNDESGHPLGIYLGAKFAKPVDQSMTAVIAAISIGMPREALLDVIKQTGLTMKTVIRCGFADVDYGDEEDPEEYVFIEDEFNPVEMTPWHISNEIIQAISLDAELSRVLADEYNATDSTQNLSVAAALANDESFWPRTRILQVIESRIRTRGSLEQATTATNLLYSGANLSSMTDKEVLDFLEKSGNLMPENSSENGFENAFFRTVFLNVSENQGKNLIRVARALNSIDDPQQLESMNLRLLQKLCDYDYSDITGWMPVLRGIRMALDEDKYSQVRNSMLLKINAVTFEGASSITKADPEKILSAGVGQFVDAPQSIFASLCKDLMATEPHDFRKGHFLAIGEFVKHLAHEQDHDQVDMNDVLLKVIRGLEAYQATDHYDYRGILHDKLKITAKDRVETLVAWMAPRMSADYKLLSKLDSSSQAMLASNGFDIKQLPNMTRRDRGEVLSNQLGL